MTYPPPPGQPGADGWQGGNDPNQKPNDPYGQPPTSGAHPYEQTAMPDSGPGNAPPSFGAPPPQPPPSGSDKNKGWIIGGVAGVVVILVAVVSTLFMTGVFNNETGTQTAAKESPKDKQKGDSKSHEPGEYRELSNVCEPLNLDVVEDAYGAFATKPTHDTSRSDGITMGFCRATFGDIQTKDRGILDVTVFVTSSPDAAKNSFEAMAKPTKPENCESLDEIEGAWEEGIVLVTTGNASGCMVGLGTTTGVFVRDGNIAIQIRIDQQGDLADGKEAETLIPLVEDVLKAAAA